MTTITITVNGEAREVPGATTVADIVASVTGDRDTRGVAVAVDAEVVPRSAWRTTALDGGQRLEILTAAQGG